MSGRQTENARRYAVALEFINHLREALNLEPLPSEHKRRACLECGRACRTDSRVCRICQRKAVCLECWRLSKFARELVTCAPCVVRRLRARKLALKEFRARRSL